MGIRSQYPRYETFNGSLLFGVVVKGTIAIDCIDFSGSKEARGSVIMFPLLFFFIQNVSGKLSRKMAEETEKQGLLEVDDQKLLHSRRCNCEYATS